MAPFFDKGIVLKGRLLLLVLFVLCAEASANSVDLPVHHWSYETVERLASMGLCGGEGLSSRPISRRAMAGKVAEALETVREGEVEFSPEEAALIEESLLRLSEEFVVELKEKGIPLVESGEKSASSHRLQKGPFALGGSFVTEKYFTSLEKEKATTLLENSKGFRLHDGLNGRFGFPFWVSHSNFLALSFYPRVNVHREDDGEVDPDFDEATVKLSYRNIYFKGGRTSYWWGSGSHGTLLLTDNARPFHSAAVGSDHPFELPWALRSLGRWNANLFLGRLSKKEVVERPLLGGWRIEWFPIRWLLFGASHLIQLGGETQKSNFGTIWDTFNPTKGGGENENPNHLYGSDFRIFIPQIAQWMHLGSGFNVYGEFYAEDTTGIYVPVTVSRQGGLRVTDLFGLSGLDLQAEVAETNSRAYQHFIYTSGYRFKGEFIGHHIGPDADDIYFRLSKRFEDNITVGVYFDRERQGRSGTSLPFGAQPKIKNEGGIDLSYHLNDRIMIQAGYELENFDNFRNSTGQEGKNHIVTIMANLRF